MGMDQFIGEPTYWGKGIGTKFVKAAITYILSEMGAEAIAMDPKVNNERAIKCYENADLKGEDFKGTWTAWRGIRRLLDDGI